MNQNVWSDLKSGDLDLEKLDQNQLDEVQNLNNKVRSIIEAKGYNTNDHSISKTNYGYEMKRKCEIESCDSLQTIEINVASGDGTIVGNFKCNHSLKSNNGKFSFKIKIKL